MAKQSSPAKAPIRIGFDATWLAAAHKSGVGYYVQNLITVLAVQYPGEVTLTGHYFAGGDTAQLVQAPNISYKVSRVVPLKLVNMLRRLHIELPFEFFTKRRFDFLFFPAYTSYPSLYHTPSTVVIYDMAFLDMPETLSPRNQKDLVRNVPRALRRASFVTTISEWTKRRIETNYHTTKPMLITYIPPLTATIPADAATIVESIGITKPYLLFVGTIEPRKNILGLLAAYEQLPENLHSGFSLVLAGGEGWQDDEIKTKLTALKQAGHSIVTTGYVSDEQRNALYAKATLFVLPSFYEGFGMPLLEAMAAGTPVVASDIPVFHEVCGDAAAYINPKDPAAMSATLAKLLNDTPARQALVTAGKKNLTRFSWPQVAQAFFEQIQKSLK